jgi:hypothetical protein
MWRIQRDSGIGEPCRTFRRLNISRNGTQDDLDVYLHMATSARKFRKLQHDEENKLKQFRRQLFEELIE